MKLSYNWLNDFIDLQGHSAQELADLLTMKTCEVEEVSNFYQFLEDIPVVLVEEVKSHPDADKLVVCKVNNGTETLQIVTGAPNVKVGKKYGHAKVGATLPNGMTMKKAKLRGLDSYGMLASAKELNLEDLQIGEEGDESGLLTLPDSFTVGISLREMLGFRDTILEIDNKSITHRPDLWSHFGFARELSVLLEKPLKQNSFLEQTFVQTSELNQKLKNPSITIEGKSARGYCGVVLDNIEVKKSALKIQARLLAVGLRPINNMVDTSNYVMLEMGQPNHAFDYQQIQEIRVVPAKEGQTIEALDEKTYALPAGTILIQDKETAVAIGGVIGGVHYSVRPTTKSLFVESACFYRSDIRKAVSALGVRTDSSQRFEKGLDTSLLQPALHRFAFLLQESCPNLVMGSIESIEKDPVQPSIINTTFNYIKSRLGKIHINKEEIVKILTRMGMEVSVLEDEIQVEVPSYRSGYDISIAEDLVEELGRMIGYLSIETEPFLAACEVPQFINKRRRLEHELKELFSKSFAFSEVYNYAFCTQDDLQNDARFLAIGKAVQLQNPIQSDLAYLRMSPLPALLKNIAENYRRYKDLRFFEIEKLFFTNKKKQANTTKIKDKEGKTPATEQGYLAGVLTSQEPNETVLTWLSSILSYTLEKCGLPIHEQSFQVLSGKSIFHPGRSGKICQKNSSKPLFHWGQVHPALIEKYHIDEAQTVFYFEAFLDDLESLRREVSNYRPIVKYPASDFELTVLMQEQQYFSELLQALGETQQEPIDSEKTFTESIEHLTTYRGENLPQGKKAVSVRITWRNNCRTLEPEEIKNRQDKLVATLKEAGFELRS